jgi:hypothetical protein
MVVEATLLPDPKYYSLTRTQVRCFSQSTGLSTQLQSYGEGASETGRAYIVHILHDARYAIIVRSFLVLSGNRDSMINGIFRQSQASGCGLQHSQTGFPTATS